MDSSSSPHIILPDPQLGIVPKESDVCHRGSLELQVGNNKVLDVNNLMVESDLDALFYDVSLRRGG